MLETICNIIASSVMSKFDKFYTMANQVKAADKSFPAIYDTKGNYKQLNIDNHAGVGYIRLLSDVTVGQSSLKPIGETPKEYKYPLRLVGYIKNSVLGKDDSFSGDTGCIKLIKSIQGITGINSALSARLAHIEVIKYSTNKEEIIKGEYEGVDQFKKAFNYNYSVISLDIVVTVNTTRCCLLSSCATYCIGVDTTDCDETTTASVCSGAMQKQLVLGVQDQLIYTFSDISGKTLFDVFIDGQRIRTNYYTRSGTTITFTDPFLTINTDQEIVIYYIS